MENQAILRRLQDKRSNYNISDWEEREKDRKKLLEQICEYPVVIGSEFQTRQNRSQLGTSQGGSPNRTNYSKGQPDLIVSNFFNARLKSNEAKELTLPNPSIIKSVFTTLRVERRKKRKYKFCFRVKKT